MKLMPKNFFIKSLIFLSQKNCKTAARSIPFFIKFLFFIIYFNFYYKARMLIRLANNQFSVNKYKQRILYYENEQSY